MSADVFISYSSNDLDRVVKLADKLRSAGVSIWVDESGIGAATLWSKEIAGAIKGCKVLVLMVTPNSVKSENVVKEVTLAAEQRKKILPVVLEPTQIPEALEYHLAGIQHLDIAGMSASESVAEILPALKRLLGMESAVLKAGGHGIRGSRNRSFNFWADWKLYPCVIMAAALGWFFNSFLHRNGSSNSTHPGNHGGALRKLELYLPAPKDPWGGKELHDLVISPDGEKYAFINGEGLWVRWLDRVSPPSQLESKNVRGIIWSPDVEEIAYFIDQNLYHVSIAGGDPRRIASLGNSVAPGSIGGAWFDDNELVFPMWLSGLHRISANGGKLTQVCALGDGELWILAGNVLPDERGFLIVVGQKSGDGQIDVWTRDGQRREILKIPDASLRSPIYSPSGHVVFQRWNRESELWAFPFSLKELQRTGEPFLISEGRNPSISMEGSLLVNLTRPRASQLVWIDQSGSVLGTVGSVLPKISTPAISPDEKRIVMTAHGNDTDLWMVDIGRNESLLLTDTPDGDFDPTWFPGFQERRPVSREGAAGRLVWHPDGSELFFLDIEQKSLLSARIEQSGTEVEIGVPSELFEIPASIRPGHYDVARDGRILMVQAVKEGVLETPSAVLIDNWFEEFREE